MIGLWQKSIILSLIFRLRFVIVSFWSVNSDCWHLFSFILNPIFVKNFTILFTANWSCFFMWFFLECVFHIVKSSAKSAKFIFDLDRIFPISLIKIVNRRGDSGLPCGTPFDISVSSDRQFFTFTQNFLSFRNDISHNPIFFGHLSLLRLRSIPLCGALSKAFSISNNTIPVCAFF